MQRGPLGFSRIHQRSSRAIAVGVGAAGNDLITHLMRAEPVGITCIASDTDPHNLEISNAHSKIRLASKAASKTDLGAETEAELRAFRKLRPLLKGADLVFVMAGMGGRTGGRAGPSIAELASSYGSIVIGLVTGPFPYQTSRSQSAVQSLRRMLDACHTLILLDNHSADHSSPTMPFRFEADPAATAACSITAAIAGLFSKQTDPNGPRGEIRRLLRHGGLAKAAVGESYSAYGAEEAALAALRKAEPVVDLKIATGLLVNFTASRSTFDVNMMHALEFLSTRIGPHVKMLVSRCVDTRLGGAARVDLIATGIPFPYAWGGYRTIPLDIHELEPESCEERALGLDLELERMEAYAA